MSSIWLLLVVQGAQGAQGALVALEQQLTSLSRRAFQ
jgi:hypothetical protein